MGKAPRTNERMCKSTFSFLLSYRLVVSCSVRPIGGVVWTSAFTLSFSQNFVPTICLCALILNDVADYAMVSGLKTAAPLPAFSRKMSLHKGGRRYIQALLWLRRHGKTFSKTCSVYLAIHMCVLSFVIWNSFCWLHLIVSSLSAKPLTPRLSKDLLELRAFDKCCSPRG